MSYGHETYRMGYIVNNYAIFAQWLIITRFIMVLILTGTEILNDCVAMAPHSSTLAWKIPWMEEPGRLQSMGPLRVRHDWAASFSLFTCMHWRRKWQATPVFLPGESQGRGSLVGGHLWGRTESDMTEATQQQQQQQCCIIETNIVLEVNYTSNTNKQTHRKWDQICSYQWQGDEGSQKVQTFSYKLSKN